MSKYDAEIRAVQEALLALQKAVATEPEANWRASILWETCEQTLTDFDRGIFDAYNLLQKSKNFRHWSEKYSSDPFVM